MADMITYAHQGAPKGPRFRQFASTPVPAWAVDVKPEDSSDEEKIDALTVAIADVNERGNYLVDLMLRIKHGRVVRDLCEAQAGFREALERCQRLSQREAA